MVEEWRTVIEDARYEVSNLGNVRSLDHIKWSGPAGFTQVKGRMLRRSIDGRGYMLVSLGFNKKRAVHTLVLEAFVCPRPKGMQCRHLDDNKKNPRLENLCWGTPKENLADQYRNGIRKPEDNSLRARKAMVTRFRKGVGIMRKEMEFDL